jgi:hypothetical protein
MKESFPWFNERREKYSEFQKMAVDQYEYADGMSDVYRGLYFLTYAMRRSGVITDHNKQYDDNEKCQNILQNNYTQRFDAFKEVMFPRYRSFEEYIQLSTKDLKEKPDEEIFTECKQLLMNGKQIL